jgi:glycosyltransferase involved in cell wall biosynthesis
MPKILYLTDGLFNGGAERQLALLVKHMPSGWTRRVFSLETGPFAEVIRASGVPVDIRERKARFDSSPAIYLWRLIRTWKPDVIHSWGWMSSVAAGPMCKCLGIRFIDGTIRTGMLPERNRLTQYIGMAWADRVIANNQAGLSVWGISSTKGRIVYNGFDPDRLPLCYPDEHRSNSPIRVVMTGRMVREKDYLTFLNAARWLINKDEQAWKFVAIGSGPDRAELMASVRDLIDAGLVEFPESGLEVLPLVNQCHIGVLMSHPTHHAEGCANSILEYMACGLPVVCVNTGGNSELVAEGETGYLISPGDPLALVDRLLRLGTIPKDAERLGQAGRQRLLAHFSVETMIQATLRVYAEVL